MNYECFIIILAMNLSVAFCLYNESILALALVNKFELSNVMIGVCFIMGAISYMIVSCLIGHLTSIIHRRYVMQIGFSLMVI